MIDTPKKALYVFIGTYTKHEGSQSKGIYVYRMDPMSGELTFEWEVKGVLNPSYLELSPQQNFLYAVHEVRNFAGEEAGGVSAFSIDLATGRLSRTGQELKISHPVCIKFTYLK